MSKEPLTQGNKPPKGLVRILRFFIKGEYLEEIEGDLEEIYYDLRITNGTKRANLKYLFELLRLFKLNLIKSIMNNHKYSVIGLLAHSIKLSFRGFNRYKTSFIINIIGLSTGIGAALLIYLWVNDEYSVDRFHKNGDRLYQVLQNEVVPEGLETDFGSPFILADQIKEKFPEIDHAVTIGNDEMSRRAIFKSETDNKEAQARGIFANSDFFKAFSFSLLSGSVDEVLSPENAIVISEQLAIALFGSIENASGKVLKANRDLYNDSYLVTGVFQNTPENSTLKFEYVASHKMALKHEAWLREWTANGAVNFITLKEGTDLESFNQKFKSAIIDQPYRDDNLLVAYPFEQLYLEGEFTNGEVSGGRIAYVRLMTSAGIFILLLACINFMNLSTAQASKRIKEIGVKKVFGVRRDALVFQLLTESFLITLLSLLVSIGLVNLLLPAVNQVVGKELSLFGTPSTIGLCAIILVAVTIIAGLYPALYLSKFQSRDLIRGRLKRGASDLWVRKGLVVLQFSVSTLFISGFLVLNNQMSYIRNVDLGYNRDDLIHFTLRERDLRQPFLDELNKIPGLISSTNLYGGSIAELRGAGGGFSWGNPIENEEITFRRPQVSYSFFETLNIDVLEGRAFSRDFQNEEQKLMINEAAAQLIGIENIVGKTIMDGNKEKEVIGIVKNFKIQSLYEPLQPAIIRFIPNGNHFMVKISKENQAETLKTIEDVYNQFNSDYPFNPKFVNDEYDQVYQAEGKVVALSGYFTIVAILIACLGLFGLALYNTERRTKEVGIRKVLGSSTFALVKLLSTDFIVLVIISLFVALPISYLLVLDWLNGFSMHYTPDILLYLVVALSTLLLSLTTVGFQTMKTSLVNPVQCLRNE
ncbi:ABC transporter permease [Roseivirga sp. E12]|uniref:ABC transporter permease n=1 Tax=Roseivirga sp. E12 TaxID=2819237 RepID=UPI001ABD0BDB|nr:ABC transporter permease [Roseivirga sp. E12]MBO3697516.1 ABC transporter permease [Roseivirga sp. E12]